MPIVSIRPKGLRLFWEKNDSSKLDQSQTKKIRRRFQILDAAKDVSDIEAAPGLKCHLLQGVDRYSIRVTGNWRMTFEFDDGQIYLLDYEDYH